jgi:ubiquinone/menaquinone biosynthesis C-methylase UbiE
MIRLTRVLEPEVMDAPGDADDYDAMDHSEVNGRFVADFLSAHGPSRGGEVLDVGTGPAQIPILLCRADPNVRVLGIDLSGSMLERACAHVERAGLLGRVRLAPADAKLLPFANGRFEGVVSNSIVHHIADPTPVLTEMARVVAPGGTLLVRDLCRPGDDAELARLVETYAGLTPPGARVLFEASLNAALNLEEIRDLVASLGLPASGVAKSSDRHWTWVWRRPG